MAATVVVIAFANIVIYACDLVKNSDVCGLEALSLIYLLTQAQVAAHDLCLKVQNRKTATDLETDMQMFLECKISSKVNITKAIPKL